MATQYSTGASVIGQRKTNYSDINRYPKYCACWCCQNPKDDGKFVGEFCMPCYELITTGVGEYGTSFIHQLKSRLKNIQEALIAVRKLTENPF
jgi:hypothetical protein